MSVNTRKIPTHPADLLFFLKQWLTEHIAKSDKALGDYLFANGPKAGARKIMAQKALRL